MLSLRRLQVVALFGLAVLLSSAATGYAEHVSDTEVEWKNTWAQIATGDHWWTNTDFYSYHYFRVENNHPRLSVWITWRWTLKLKLDGKTLTSDAAESKEDSIRVRPGRAESRQGTLSANLAGGMDEEVYQLVSTTEIQLKNASNFRSGWFKVSHTTRIDNE